MYYCRSPSPRTRTDAALIKTRPLHEHELELWHQVTRDVRRASKKRPMNAVAEKRQAMKAKSPEPVPKKPVSHPRPAAPVVRAAPVGAGLDGSTSDKLRRGKIEPQANLDLHGLNQVQAHARLTTFIKRCAESGLRCVLVVTGKGAPSSQRDDARSRDLTGRSKSGVLKEMVPRWLHDGDVRALVAGSQTAHVKHGGAGALYVYLRRRKI